MAISVVSKCLILHNFLCDTADAVHMLSDWQSVKELRTGVFHPRLRGFFFFGALSVSGKTSGERL